MEATLSYEIASFLAANQILSSDLLRCRVIANALQNSSDCIAEVCEDLLI